jgi:hypothetical protein
LPRRLQSDLRRHPGHLYFKGTSTVAWLAAATGCRAHQRAFLAVPDDAAELAALQALAAGTFWVGISDRLTEGTFVAETGGAPTFLSWKNGEPDAVGDQDCVEATATTISTDDCTGSRLFVCECEL